MGTDAIRYTWPWFLEKNSDGGLFGQLFKLFDDGEMKDAKGAYTIGLLDMAHFILTLGYWVKD